MAGLMAFSRAIDAINERIGSWVKWFILAAVLISTINAIIRKIFNASSNGWLEAQWYLFAAVFMLGAAYTFLKNEHVRIDIVTSNFSKRVRDWIDVLGHIFFLLPFCCLMVYYGTPFFLNSIIGGEVSANAGGLILWPAKLLVPLGFFFIFLQGLSELIKRIAILQGIMEDPHGQAIGHGAAAEAEAQRLLQQAQELAALQKS